MSDRIVEITQHGYRLMKHLGFLEVYNKKEKIGNIDLDSIISVIISSPGCTISTVLIDELSQRNIPLIIVGNKYLPTSMTLSINNYQEQYKIIQAQSKLTEPNKKKAWQQIIKSKISNQALVLNKTNSSGYTRLKNLEERVKSGDIDNCEAQASRIYWQSLFGSDFRRDINMSGINSALNYTYAILRSCVARGVVAAGLHPSLSLHHRNKRNPFNLIDDLMEPFRPSVDYLIWQHSNKEDFMELTPEIKEILVSILNDKVCIKNKISPISIATIRFGRSFADYCLKEVKNLELPILFPKNERKNT